VGELDGVGVGVAVGVRVGLGLGLGELRRGVGLELAEEVRCGGTDLVAGRLVEVAGRLERATLAPGGVALEDGVGRPGFVPSSVRVATEAATTTAITMTSRASSGRETDRGPRRRGRLAGYASPVGSAAVPAPYGSSNGPDPDPGPR
jgi:hypothetical protein